MQQEMVQIWKDEINKKWNNIPDWIKGLVCEVLDKYWKCIREYPEESGCSTTVYPIRLWYCSVDFLLEPYADKRNFPSKSLKKIVEKHENFYLGEFCKSDGSCANTLRFYYKRP